MGEKRVIEHEASDEIFNDDWLLKDSVLNGTKKVQPSVIKEYVNQGMATTTALANEATTRANADTALGGRIDDEATARQQADTALGQRIDNLNFSADAISYDNETSGLEADNVQDAIDETITKLSAVGTASGAIATFPDGSDLPMPKLEVAIEPVQDLHGYDAPWVGGAGKNKVDLSKSTTNRCTINKNNDTYTFTATGSYYPRAQINLSALKDIEDLYVSFEIGGTSTRKIVRIEERPDGTSVQTLAQYNTTNVSHIKLSDISNCTQPTLAIYIDNTDGGVVGSTLTLTNFIISTGANDNYEPYSNICPISGWSEVNVGVSGVNVWDEEWEVGGISVNTGQNESANDIIRCKNHIHVKPNTTYHIVDSSKVYCLFLYDKNKNYITSVNVADIQGANYTTRNDCHYIRFRCFASYGITYNNNISINYPSTDTNYHAYNGHTYTIDLDGTRYGGKVDLVSGVMTVDRAILNMGNLTWTYYDDYFYTIVNGKAVGNYNILSSNYKVTSESSATAMHDGEIKGHASNTNLYVKDSRYTSASDFKTAMNGVQLVYELATPLTIQLTPTVIKSLVGQNNVWADTGDILDAKYIRDMTAIINYILEQLGN